MPDVERGAGSFADKLNDTESDVSHSSMCSWICGKRLTPLNVRAHCDNFVDQHGRNLTLRGVNLAGSSKQPTRPASQSVSHKADAFFSSAETVSFVGRPFPLNDRSRARALSVRFTLDAHRPTPPRALSGRLCTSSCGLVSRYGRYTTVTVTLCPDTRAYSHRHMNRSIRRCHEQKTATPIIQ